MSNFEYQYIDPKYLRVDPSYQREIKQKQVNDIVKEFDDNVFNEPKVSKREDGFYYIFNGDHSVAAHKIKYGKDKPILCKVFYGLTRDEEMRLFIKQNGISRQPTRIEKIRAMANYDDPDVVSMIASAKTVGITIEFKANPGANKIMAVDTAFQVYQDIGRENFINMLYVIKGIWNGDCDSFQSGMLKGFGYIYKHCSKQMSRISNSELISKFSGYPVKKLVERSKELTGGMGKRFAIAITEHYNKHKRSGKIILP